MFENIIEEIFPVILITNLLVGVVSVLIWGVAIKRLIQKDLVTHLVAVSYCAMGIGIIALAGSITIQDKVSRYTDSSVEQKCIKHELIPRGSMIIN